MSGVKQSLIIIFLLLSPYIVSAAEEQLTPTDAIFNSRHLDLVSKGSTVKYKFQHTVSDEKLMGQPFSDDIKLNISDVNAEGLRILDVTVFTGERQRPTQNYDGLSVNPVFVWFLDKCVENYGLLSGGSHPYLKGRFREAFLTKAKIESTKLDYNGKSIDGYKVTIVPFEDDPKVNKMQGFEKSKFTFTMSQQIPGYFYELGSDFFSSQPGTGKMQDRLVLVEAK